MFTIFISLYYNNLMAQTPTQVINIGNVGIYLQFFFKLYKCNNIFIIKSVRLEGNAQF